LHADNRSLPGPQITIVAVSAGWREHIDQPSGGTALCFSPQWCHEQKDRPVQ